MLRLVWSIFTNNCFKEKNSWKIKVDISLWCHFTEKYQWRYWPPVSFGVLWCQFIIFFINDVIVLVNFERSKQATNRYFVCKSDHVKKKSTFYTAWSNWSAWWMEGHCFRKRRSSFTQWEINFDAFCDVKVTQAVSPY